jgi:3-oxoacyl-[acyl-carrier-protein] synthase II
MTERTRRRVVITGLGTISPVGNSVAEAWQAALQGKSGVAPITLFDASDLPTQFAGEVKDFDPAELFGRREARRMDRFTQFALAAAQEAMADSGLEITPGLSPRAGVVMGTAVGGMGTVLVEMERALSKGYNRVSPFLGPMMLPDTGPAQIAIAYGMRGPNISIATACASATNAIGEASEMIRRGVADVIITGGAEAALAKLAVAGFCVMQALSRRNGDPERASRPFDLDRDGFVIAEGAGALVLESEEYATARGARIYGEVIGYGTSEDAYHLAAPAESGEGAILAMENALKDADIEPGEVDYLNAHGTGTKLNDISETLAIKAVFGEKAYALPTSSTKGVTGHMLGAAGALEAIYCLKTIETGQIPPTANYEVPDPECDLDYVPNHPRKADIRVTMSNSFGLGGHNASIILGTYHD